LKSNYPLPVIIGGLTEIRVIGTYAHLPVHHGKLDSLDITSSFEISFKIRINPLNNPSSSPKSSKFSEGLDLEVV
jgi:hypothetical protein